MMHYSKSVSTFLSRFFSDNYFLQVNGIQNSYYVSATMFKIIKEMLPPDVRVARDAQDLLVECCVGKSKLSSPIALLYTSSLLNI